MHVHRFGSGKPRILALHGFAQQGGHFWEIAPYFGAAVVAPDLPGHGPKPHLPATMAEAVDRVVDLVDEYEPDILLGYSMGGRVALRALLRRRLPYAVIVSAGAGITDPTERGTRQTADEELASRIEVGGMGLFIDEWNRLSMFAGLANRGASWQERERSLRLENEAGGVAASLRGMGQGVTRTLSDEDLGRIDTPVLCLTGAADEKYVAAGEHLVGALPSGRLEVHPSAGHNPIGEDPGWVAIHIRRSL